jgi:glycosyl transferase family 25
MKTLVINLAAEEARWAAVRRQFLSADLEPFRFDAVEGAALGGPQRRRLYSEALNQVQYHKPLTAGEIGCYASHIAVWRQLLESDEPHLAVFEDDVDIDMDLAATLEAIARAPADWDLVKLIGRRRERPRARLPLAPGRSLIEYRRVPGLTCAYVVNRRGAEKLLRHRVPFGRPIDVDLRHWWECQLRVLGVHPYPVHPAPSSLLSTIDGRRSPADAPTRLRKLLLQARYTTRNWQSVHGFGGPPPHPQARGPVRLIDHAAP